MNKKRGQVTIFIIIALVLVFIVGAYFIFRGDVGKDSLPVFAEPIETTFLNCLEERTLEGISILGVMGGSIYEENFEAGSRYMPFSSHLSFMDNNVPYWFYISGNNFPREEIPSKSDMEEDLERFIENNILKCDLNSYYDQDYVLSKGIPKVKIRINERSVDVDLDLDLTIQKDSERFVIKNHVVEVKSKIGSLYEDALNLYEHEQEELFLERYAIDFLRLYAPVDGVELTCSPLVWNAQQVFEDVKEAVELNTLALRSSGDKSNYFVLDLPVNNEVRFINSKNWPTVFEVLPSEGNTLIAEPVGNQQGLGILGFCYVPYHFVYDLGYPVLIQVYDKDTLETFQFPMTVIINKNKERKALEGSSLQDEFPNLCEYPNSLTTIRVYNSKNQPLEADVSFNCFASSCYLGKAETVDGSLTTMLPQCVNGNLVARAPGYSESSMIYSSVQEGSATLFLDKEFEKEILFKVDGKVTDKKTIISFFTEEGVSQAIILPENNKVMLSAGSYSVEAYVYDESSITFEQTTRQECIEVPTLVGGIFGLTKEECFDINVPEQIISSVLVGGGKTSIHFTEDQLENNDFLEILSGSLAKPNTIEELQTNYILYEDKELEVSLR